MNEAGEISQAEVDEAVAEEGAEINAALADYLRKRVVMQNLKIKRLQAEIAELKAYSE